MDNLIAVYFEAHNPAMDHHRWYSIDLGIDLFGDWTLAFRYGRSGKRGQELRVSSSDREWLRKRLQECLRRRLTAQRRIGCCYMLRDISAMNESLVDEWLPPDWMAGFRTVTP